MKVVYSEAAALATVEGAEIPQWFEIQGCKGGVEYRLEVLIDGGDRLRCYRAHLAAVDPGGFLLHAFSLEDVLEEAKCVLLRGGATLNTDDREAA